MKLHAVLRVAGLGAVLAFPAAGLADNAESFQNELGFSFGQMSDSNDTFESTTLQFDAVHYLEPVKVAGHPLAEAAFLEHAAGISFLLRQSNTDNTGFFSFSVEQTTYAAQFDYASTISPFTFTVAYAGSKLTSDDVDVELSSKEYFFKIGSYVGNAARIQAIFDQIDFEDGTGSAIGVEGKLIHALGNETALGIYGMLFRNKSDSGDESSNGHGYTFNVDYYINHSTSIGITRDWQTFEDQDTSFDSWTHHLHIKRFLSPRASIALEYLNSDQESATDGFNVKLALRF